MGSDNRALDDEIAHGDAKLEARQAKLTEAFEQRLTGDDWRHAMESAARFRAPTPASVGTSVRGSVACCTGVVCLGHQSAAQGEVIQKAKWPCLHFRRSGATFS